uniref:hypothetical protein n=1 Tax=Candidatus Nitrososphaera gargensis TaxID=497727 RepID=UPI0038996897
MCHACGYSCNADYNGAVNLGNRLMGHIFINGIVGFQCENRTDFYDPISQVVHQPKP